MHYDDFAITDFDGRQLSPKNPSKELTLHRYYYDKNPEIKAVIHTHGHYAVLWSCLEFDHNEDIIPEYTPYLRMKVGSIGLIPFAKPGTEELFEMFKNNLNNGDAYLLKNHGGIVGGKNIYEAFYGIEELEESSKIAWEVMNTKLKIKTI